MKQKLLLLLSIITLCVLCACGQGRHTAALPAAANTQSVNSVSSPTPDAASAPPATKPPKSIQEYKNALKPKTTKTPRPVFESFEPSYDGFPIYTPVPTPDPLTSLYAEKDFAPQPISVPFSVTVVLSPDPTPTPTPKPSPPPGLTGEDISLYALEFLGYPYVWGEESPECGFDCSGLVFYVYGHFNYELSRVSEYMAYDGVHVEPEDIEPGDILCFPRGPGSKDYYHVGIYIGGWEYIHARDSASGVVVSSLDERKFGFEARRLVGVDLTE